VVMMKFQTGSERMDGPDWFRVVQIGQKIQIWVSDVPKVSVVKIRSY